jgi:hypothetical protein
MTGRSHHRADSSYEDYVNHVGIRLVAHTIEQTAATKIMPQTFIESDVARTQVNHVGIRLVAHTLEQTAAAGIKTQPQSRADFEDALYFNVIEAPLKSLSHYASDYKTMMQYDDSGF